VEVNLRFGEIYHLHLQDRRIRQVRKQLEASSTPRKRCFPQVNLRFGGIYHLHLQDRRIRQVRKQLEASSTLRKRCFPPKRRLTFNVLHSVIYQKIETRSCLWFLDFIFCSSTDLILLTAMPYKLGVTGNIYTLSDLGKTGIVITNIIPYPFPVRTGLVTDRVSKLSIKFEGETCYPNALYTC
jgi:hypothetical protein